MGLLLLHNSLGGCAHVLPGMMGLWHNKGKKFTSFPHTHWTVPNSESSGCFLLQAAVFCGLQQVIDLTRIAGNDNKKWAPFPVSVSLDTVQKFTFVVCTTVELLSTTTAGDARQPRA